MQAMSRHGSMAHLYAYRRRLKWLVRSHIATAQRFTCSHIDDGSDGSLTRILLTLGRYYPRNTVIPVVIPKKSCFCQEGKSLRWVEIDIVNPIEIFDRKSSSICASVVQRSRLGAFWEGSEVRVKVQAFDQKKK